jgi:hypothetical protein
MKLLYVILLIIGIVLADKILTVINIKSVQKNYPRADPLQIEQNPLAKWFFKKSGLLWGSIFYSIISITVALIAYFSFRTLWGSEVAIGIVLIVYIIVLINNLGWLFFKYGRTPVT